MPNYTYSDLLDEKIGKIRLCVLKSMARRRANREYGCVCPRSLRQALQYYGHTCRALEADWRSRHGLPIATAPADPQMWDHFAKYGTE